MDARSLVETALADSDSCSGTEGLSGTACTSIEERAARHVALPASVGCESNDESLEAICETEEMIGLVRERAMQQGAILSVLRSRDWAKASCLQAVLLLDRWLPCCYQKGMASQGS